MATYNGWNRVEKLARLQCFLRDKTPDRLPVCSLDEQADFHSFVTALSRRFGQIKYALLAIKDGLSTRIQKRGESLLNWQRISNENPD